MQDFESQWNNIMSLARQHQLPLDKKRAILREYLQSQFLGFLYRQKGTQGLHFIGGTSLRLLRGLDRFSEDLDFDNTNLTTQQLHELFTIAVAGFAKLGLNLEFVFHGIKVRTWRAELKFGQSLLKVIGVTGHKQEKLNIQLDATQPQYSIEREAVLLNKFGVTEQIVTNTLPTLLSQKILAALERRAIRGRDFYDIAWLLSCSVVPNLQTLEYLNIKSLDELTSRLQKRYQEIKPNLPQLKRQLQPFLINEENVKYLDYFEDMVEQINK